jgi:hypothetical protein
LKIVKIAPWEAPNVYYGVTGYIESALKYGHGELSLQSIYNMLIGDLMQMWIVVDDDYRTIGCFLTEVRKYAENKTVVIPVLGGSRLTEWIGLMDTEMDKFCKEMNAKYLEVIGRKGWEKILNKYRFKQSYICLHREV